MGNFFTASTMGELLKELKTAERIAELDKYIGDCQADQRHSTGVSFQKAMRDVNAVRAAMHKTPAAAPKSGNAGFDAARRRWKLTGHW